MVERSWNFATGEQGDPSEPFRTTRSLVSFRYTTQGIHTTPASSYDTYCLGIHATGVVFTGESLLLLEMLQLLVKNTSSGRTVKL